jgi:hypothetical protein
MTFRKSPNTSWLYPQKRRRASAFRRDVNRGEQAAGSGVLENWYLSTTKDTTAPTLTSATVITITSSGGTPRVTTDEGNGTLYMVIVTNGDIPSVVQIKAGQNSSGAAALASQNISVTTPGIKTFSAVTSLSPTTNYDVWFVHTDALANNSVAVKADLLTAATWTSIPTTLFWAFP